MARVPRKPSRTHADDPVPPVRSIRGLAEAAQACRACPLYANATQAVFGEGPAAAAMVLVGEQPGNEEDLTGHPFVGPAGAVLEKALAEAGIDRASVYVTNAVKHFKWEPRGKRRIHKKPRVSEIKACQPWLEAELTRIKPARDRLHRHDRRAIAARPEDHDRVRERSGVRHRLRPRRRHPPSVLGLAHAGARRTPRGARRARRRSRGAKLARSMQT